MTQTVFDNAMTAHVWAQQTQDSGRSHNGNFYFEGRNLWSYGTHYCVGYAMPDPTNAATGILFLLNADSSSMTTNGKHKPAAFRAVRGGYDTIPGLTETARAISRALDMPKAERVRSVARHLESYGGVYWPSEGAASRIFRALGCSDKEAARRARAGQARVLAKQAKIKAAEVKQAADSAARDAKRIAADDPRETAQEVRDLLARAAGAIHQFETERNESEAAGIGRAAYRAAKAARAKGWTRIAAQCSAHHKAARAEIRRYHAQAARYAERANLRNDCKAIRGAADQIAQFWAMNPQARDGATVADYRSAVISCMTGAKGLEQLARALRDVGLSRYAAHVMTPEQWGHGLRTRAEQAQEAADQLRARGNALRLEWQADARAAWLADGTRPPYEVGQLSDANGAALLRAEGVERDETGAIVGGDLRTSWGATVPLPHAIRAFRFLRHCRDTATAWQANGRTLRVGHFRVDRVDAQGNFVAGCHRISWAECARLAESLGLSELAGADTTEKRGALV